ncbi:Protein CBG00331 [Caenorhabditis briggsae]|uniref:Protein CBG00331 n=1 Tax=Caenorhabditis briggsae TaxID=6238 RepID=A8WMU5_CAEBR|nr:Protein CBG00331 [Caenorhabditis briggsae]CAP21800.2 Protein CBG00331 [Caenorhabditis briggsae]
MSNYPEKNYLQKVSGNTTKGAPGSACPNGPNPVGLCKALNMGENGDGEDKGSNQSSLIALLLIVLLI